MKSIAHQDRSSRVVGADHRPLRSHPAARQCLEARFEREVDEADPEGLMSPADRVKAVESKRNAYYLRLALKSAESRRRRRRRPTGG
ncbi:hypothetical protein AB0H36_05090 [Kribbella sp. NPDC050820]|uniref:hypothetical protein n=1 Tax=Kribbella sp. NPDC050820 TaxID=3155408 RepID=UPI0033E97CDD